MANDVTGSPWRIDTQSATAITTDMIRVSKFRWVSPAAIAGHLCVVKNAAGKIVWRSVAAGGNFIDDSSHDGHGPVGNVKGLIVDDLDSGVLDVYLL